MQENEIQTACADALAVYFDRRKVNYRQLWTYSNQQGNGSNRFCGDLVGVVEDCQLLLLEFKALNHGTKTLNSFDSTQFKEAVEMEMAGLPLMYTYDFKNLAYYDSKRANTWPLDTLKAMKVSEPTALKSAAPLIKRHMTLFDWLKLVTQASGANLLEDFGQAIGRVLPSKMRNGLLMFIYSKKHKQAFALGGDGLYALYDWLHANPGATPKRLDRKIQELKDAIARAVAQSKHPNKMKRLRKP